MSSQGLTLTSLQLMNALTALHYTFTLASHQLMSAFIAPHPHEPLLVSALTTPHSPQPTSVFATPHSHSTHTISALAAPTAFTYIIALVVMTSLEGHVLLRP